MADVPYMDDFYDNLYFTHIFLSADSWLDKVAALKWQYHEHQLILNKLIYVLVYLVFDRTDFIFLSLLGNAQLIGIAFLLLRLFYQPQSDSTLDKWAMAIPFFFLFGYAHWQSAYWAMASISSFSVLLFPLLMLHFLCHRSSASLFLPFVCAFLLMYSQGNGVVFLPLSAMLVLCYPGMPSRMKVEWIILVAICLLFFILNYSAKIPFVGISEEEIKLRLIENLAKIPVGFFMLFASALFSEASSIKLATITGLLVFCFIALTLVFMWKTKSKCFYVSITLISYIAISFLLVSIGRVPHSNIEILLDSHYKIYSLVLFSWLCIIWYQYSNNYDVKVSIILIVVFVFFLSCYRYLPKVQSNNQRIRQTVTEWAVSGERATLQDSAFLQLSEQILYMSFREGVYSPFTSSKGALYQHTTPQLKETCQIQQKANGSLAAKIQTNKGAVAALLSVRKNSSSIEKLYLCSEKRHYELQPREHWTSKVLINKSQLAIGNYKLYVQLASGESYRLKSELSFVTHRVGLPCQTEWSNIMFRVRDEIAQELCR